MGSKLQILDFDIENRPLAYLGQGFTTAEITAIAWGWMGKPKTIQVRMLGVHDPGAMLDEFRHAYDQADVVTGHYIRAHDLPIINAAMIEFGLPILDAKLTVDTKLDLVKRKDLSASQENMSSMFGIREGKAHMSNTKWREANRLTPEGLKMSEKRAAGDVRQHMAMYKIMVERNLLKAPRVWRP